jgi:pimeloyl-ACP methyl ester carboxylesterase
VSEFVLIPGAGGSAAYWTLVAAELRRRGYEAHPVELPTDDDTIGLDGYASVVLGAAPRGCVLVAQSMGAFTAAPVAAELRAERVVLLNAMIPVPGETPGQWWSNVGAVEARIEAAAHAGYPSEFDVFTYFLHDVPADVLATLPEPKPQSERPFADPCDFAGWPAPVSVVAGRDDRFFPVALQQRLARERVGVQAVVIDGGHLAALSNSVGVVEAILAP